MNRAIKLPQYSDMKGFSTPSGVGVVPIDKNTWLPADASCPQDYYIGFLDGTVPASTCSHMGESPQTLMQKLFSHGTTAPNVAPATAPQPPGSPPPETTEPPEKKKNIFQKIFGGGDKTPQTPASAPPQ
jgi:penicillin-binding protein 1B